jgi:hypothetical protein
MTWPATWPPEVADWYESQAMKYGWPGTVAGSMIASVEFIRQLDESDLPRTYLQGEFEGVRYLWEAVHDGATLTAVRQVYLSPDGRARRYSWRRLEDDAGGLTDQPLEPAPGMTSTSQEEFLAAWGYQPRFAPFQARSADGRGVSSSHDRAVERFDAAGCDCSDPVRPRLRASSQSRGSRGDGVRRPAIRRFRGRPPGYRAGGRQADR